MATSKPKQTNRKTKPKTTKAQPSPRSAASSEKKPRSGAEGTLNPRTKQEIRLILLIFLCFMLAMSYYTPFFGVVGSFIKNVGMFIFGLTAYAIPVFAAIAGFHLLAKGTLKPHVHRYIAALCVCVFVSGLFAVHSYRVNPTIFGGGYTQKALEEALARNPEIQIYNYSGPIDLISNVVQAAKNGNGGGIMGYLAAGFLIKLISPVGTTVLLWALTLAFAALATGKAPFLRLIELIRKRAEKAGENREADKRENDKLSFGELETVEYEKNNDAENPPRKKLSKALRGKPIEKAEPSKPEKKRSAGKGSGEAKNKKHGEKRAKTKKIKPEIVASDSPSQQVKIKLFDVQPEDDAPGEELSSAEIPEDVEKMAMKESGAVKAEQKSDTTPIPVTDEEIDTEYIPYKFPPVKLLGREKVGKDAASPEDIRSMGNKLIETLRSFGVEAKINEITRGPAITRFEISPAAGVKVSKIVNLANDIALNLAAVSVRVIAPIPGKAAVGIEIPNEHISIVRLRDVLDTDEFRSFKSKTAFALGKDVNGKVKIADISKMPHLLIAGSTGSGKSVCINSLITSIIYKADPNEVKLIMIDPKVVELNVYNGIPHLLIPVVTDPRRAAGALNWAVQEMVKRYKLFAENNVRNLAGYNEYAQLAGERKLEQIIIIVDELADLMMVSAKEVEDSICRLAQMARAAGMYLVIATQRPSVDVITGLIKANIPSRIAFAVANQIDSRTILDMGGAEKLLGRGDMLYLPMGASTPTRIQGAFVSDAETEAIVEYIKQDFTAKYDEDVMEHIERGAEAEGSKRSSDDEADDMLPAAIQAVVEAGQASASLLQRRLKVGYARAGRLIDQLEERGIIGPHEGSKPREVLISRSQLMEMEAMGDDV